VSEPLEKSLLQKLSPDVIIIGSDWQENFKKYSLGKEDVENIIHSIEAHRFRNKIVPNTLEAKVLFDADKLDSIGAVGLGRAFLFAGIFGADLHNPNVDIKKTKEYTKDDSAYREFLVKLSKIKM